MQGALRPIQIAGQGQARGKAIEAPLDLRYRRPTRAASRSNAASDATNVFVAATLSSGPAIIGKTTSQAFASGLSVSFTRAAVSAPASRAKATDSTMSSLRPAWEIAKNICPSS